MIGWGMVVLEGKLKDNHSRRWLSITLTSSLGQMMIMGKLAMIAPKPMAMEPREEVGCIRWRHWGRRRSYTQDKPPRRVFVSLRDDIR